MLKSIQWKLVIISFLLVWLAMSIVGVIITQSIKKEQMDTMKADIVSRGSYLADDLKDKMVGAVDIQNTVSNWFAGQGKQIREVHFYQNGKPVAIAPQSNINDASMSSAVNYAMIDYIVDRAVAEKKVKVVNDTKGNDYLKSIAIPVFSSSQEIVGTIYISADLSSVETSMKAIGSILSNATIWALCITILLGSFLARTITGPIKEVTSQAEKLAKGDFGQIISVKSNDEVGQLTEMFNYLTFKLKSTLDEMGNEKNKVETILTNMTDGIIAVSKDGDILHANPAVYSMFRVEKESIMHKNFDEIAEELEIGITCEDLFSEQDNNNNILNINEKIIKVNIVLFQNEKNEVAGAIIVLQDVTEQERLDKMRKEFVANVSHELRTPLTTIKSYTETLLDGAMENKEYAENFLKVIDSESERMTRLVKDLLQLSKLDYDKVQWNMQQVDVAKLVQDCVFKMKISANQKNQELTVAVGADIPEINADKDRIEQVIVNIVNNALKYTPENGKIHVAVVQDNKNIIIKVIDSGIGIPKEDLPRLFERFYRVDKARSRMLGGTGLGLSIARQIVEAHNGFIDISSEYGKGTEVSINLPYCA